jgi:hypothetical protein
MESNRAYLGTYKRWIWGSVIALCCLATAVAFIGAHREPTSGHSKDLSAFIVLPSVASPHRLPKADSPTRLSASPENPEEVEGEKFVDDYPDIPVIPEPETPEYGAQYGGKTRFAAAREQKRKIRSGIVDMTVVQDASSGVCCSEVFDNATIAELSGLKAEDKLAKKPHDERRIGELDEIGERDVDYMKDQHMFSFNGRNGLLCGPIPQFCCPESNKEALFSGEVEECLAEMAQDPRKGNPSISQFLHLTGRPLMWYWRSPRMSLEKLFEAS